jgi:RNA polymerase sigma-70 factor (sigma-E family)
MSLWRTRDEGAYSDFAAAVTPRLFRSALLMSGDWHLAEDLVQTTLAKLYVAWPKVDAARSAEAYAMGTLTKSYLSHARTRRNAERPTDQIGVDLATSDDLSRVELFDALRLLDATDRTIVVLRYWNDLSVDDTAAKTGLSAAAVRTRCSRALARLRDELSEGTTDKGVSP